MIITNTMEERAALAYDKARVTLYGHVGDYSLHAMSKENMRNFLPLMRAALEAGYPIEPAPEDKEGRYTDTERLDWLARRYHTSPVYMDGTALFSHSRTAFNLRGVGFRAALDAAINEERGRDDKRP